jgi:outer membrane protein TolC
MKTNIIKKLVSALVPIITANFISAQTMSLKQIQDSVIANHPSMKIYDYEIKSMDAVAKGAKAWMPPTVGAGLYMAPYNVDLWRKRDGMNGMGAFELSVEQMFPNKKDQDAKQAYMKAMSLVPKTNKQAKINELLAEAKSQYYDLYTLQKKIEVVQDNQKLLSFMINDAEIRYKNNMGKINAYYKAKAALGSAKNMELMYAAEIRSKKIRLNSLMKRNAQESFEINRNIELKDYNDIVFTEELFYNNRSDLKTLDNEIKINSLKMETERTALKPQFGVRYSNMLGFGGQPTQFSLMLMVKLPLVPWASKMNKANIESLKFQEEVFQAEKKTMSNEMIGMAYGMRNEINLAKEQIALYENEIIPNLKKNYQTMQLGYQQNTEELFELYDAWEKLNMTQLEYIEIITKALQNQVTIDKLLEQF